MGDTTTEPTNKPGRRAGVIGLGMMGGGVARSLLAAGFAVAVHDVRPEAVATLVELGATGCATPAEVATRADVVVIVVFDADQVGQVLFGSDGVVDQVRPGLVALSCATIDPSDVERLAAQGRDAGLTVLDVGIAGGPDAAANGGLVTLVGGEAEAVAAAGPVLDAMSVEVVHAGPTGSGMKLKLVKNTMSYLTMCAVHEALLLGEELGFDAELVRHVAEASNLVDHFFWFPMSRPSARPLSEESDADTVRANRFFVDVARKDLIAAEAAGAAAGVDLPVAALARELADRYFLLPESRPSDSLRSDA